MRWVAILAAGLLAVASGPAAQAREPAPAAGAADLPFTVTLVPGMSVTKRDPGPDFDIYDVVAIDAAFVSIYVGCCAGFPIYADRGARVESRPGGLKVAVLNGRVVEYLWTRASWPHQLHVWAQLDPTIDANTVDKTAASIRPKG